VYRYASADRVETRECRDTFINPNISLPAIALLCVPPYIWWLQKTNNRVNSLTIHWF